MKKSEKFFKSSTKYIFNQQSATHEGAARGLSPRSLLATPLVVWFTTYLRECMYSMLTPAKQSLSVTPSNQSSAVSKIREKNIVCVYSSSQKLAKAQQRRFLCA